MGILSFAQQLVDQFFSYRQPFYERASCSLQLEQQKQWRLCILFYGLVFFCGRGKACFSYSLYRRYAKITLVILWQRGNIAQIQKNWFQIRSSACWRDIALSIQFQQIIDIFQDYKTIQSIFVIDCSMIIVQFNQYNNSNIDKQRIFEMSRSSAQKSSVSVVSIPKKPQGPPPFDPAKYATKNISVEDVSKLKECFDVFDYDKSGNISPEELTTAIKALGLEKDAAKILNIVNSQTDVQQMDFPTFLSIFGFSDEANSEKSLQQLFEVFDKKGEGLFGVEQFAKVCQEVGQRFSQAQIQQMILYADKDGDGKINFEQFVEIVTKQYPTI